MSVLLMLTLLIGANPDRSDLGGRVVNQAGEPLRGATATEPAIALNRGAFLAGRVMRKGEPLPGVGVGYVTVIRSDTVERSRRSPCPRIAIS
jgi:hypothetical protein